jgi:hypothetical protein
VKVGVFILLFFVIIAATWAKKEKMVVQLYAVDTSHNGGLLQVTAYLILPDGTHAKGICMTTPYEKRPCIVESFKPEARKPDQCEGNHCVYKENYKAERKGNDVTLFAANGKVVFHVESSW